MEQNRTIISVGIDVSKRKLDIACLFSDNTNVIKQFDNNTNGIEKLISFLKKQETAKTVPCVIESTGDYYLLSAIMISQVGFYVNAINPLITKKFQNASIRNAKTDIIDALRLAKIGLTENDLPVFSQTNPSIYRKKIVNQINMLDKTKQQLQQSSKQFKETEKMLGVHTADFSHIETILKLITKQIILLKKFLVSQTDKKIQLLAKKTKGITVEQMSIINTYFSDKIFIHRDQLSAFAGLDVAKRQSGKWQGREKISKRGNSYLRKALFQAAWGLAMHNEHYKDYYNKKYKEQKKHYYTVLIAIARKFLRFLFSKVYATNPTYAHSVA